MSDGLDEDLLAERAASVVRHLASGPADLRAFLVALRDTARGR